MSAIQVIGIQIAQPKTYGSDHAADPMSRTWNTAFFKDPVTGPVAVTPSGLEGDGQADPVHHGGADKAICVYPAEHYESWEHELGIALSHAAFGENFTTLGMMETDVCIGDVFSCGEVSVQISQPRQPCWKLARRWRIKDLAARVDRTGKSGWYFRVLGNGFTQAGDVFKLVQRVHPEWTVASANEVMHHRRKDLIAANALAQCQALSASWRSSLQQRVASGEASNADIRLQGPNG